MLEISRLPYKPNCNLIPCLYHLISITKAYSPQLCLLHFFLQMSSKVGYSSPRTKSQGNLEPIELEMPTTSDLE